MPGALKSEADPRRSAEWCRRLSFSVSQGDIQKFRGDRKLGSFKGWLANHDPVGGIADQLRQTDPRRAEVAGDEFVPVWEVAESPPPPRSSPVWER